MARQGTMRAVDADEEADGPPEGTPLDDDRWVLQNESSLLDALTQADAALQQEWTPARVRRIRVKDADGTEGPLMFRVRPITADEWEKAQRRSLGVRPGGRPGAARDTIQNEALQREVIVVTTHPEDAKRLWKSRAVREHYGVLTPADVVKEMLLPGEAANIANGILELAGFLSDPMEVSKSAD
jgi:hypothetical protein